VRLQNKGEVAGVILLLFAINFLLIRAKMVKNRRKFTEVIAKLKPEYHFLNHSVHTFYQV